LVPYSTLGANSPLALEVTAAAIVMRANVATGAKKAMRLRNVQGSIGCNGERTTLVVEAAEPIPQPLVVLNHLKTLARIVVGCDKL